MSIPPYEVEVDVMCDDCGTEHVNLLVEVIGGCWGDHCYRCGHWMEGEHAFEVDPDSAHEAAREAKMGLL